MNIHPLDTAQRALGPLGGIGVIVTRPQRQAAGLARKLAAIGATPLLWPAIVILPPLDPVPLECAHATIATTVNEERIRLIRHRGVCLRQRG